MKKMMFLIYVMALPILVIITSCTKMGDNTMSSGTTEFVAFSPGNDAKDVPVNKVITLRFAKSVDPQIIEKNFKLIRFKEMKDTLCPQYNEQAHKDMGKAMADMGMMRHLMNQHNTTGSFSWNGDSTICEFIPDSALDADMDYMMFADEEMVKHMEDMMGMMGGNGMMGNSYMKISDCPCHKNDKSNSMMIHFRTRADISR